jgi:hypothetical protein
MHPQLSNYRKIYGANNQDLIKKHPSRPTRIDWLVSPFLLVRHCFKFITVPLALTDARLGHNKQAACGVTRSVTYKSCQL